MRIVANIKESSVHTDRIHPDLIGKLKEAYENGEWLWLISVWNNHKVTNTRICSSCPDSIEIVKEFLPDLWQQL